MQPVEGVLVQYVPEAIPAIDSSTGKAIHPSAASCISSSTGYFEKYILRNTNFIVTIPAIGLRQTIRIPDQDEADLFTLTAIGVEVIQTSTTAGPQPGGGTDDW